MEQKENAANEIRVEKIVVCLNNLELKFTLFL